MPSRDACVKRSKVLLKDRSKAQVLVEGLHNGFFFFFFVAVLLQINCNGYSCDKLHNGLIKIREYFVGVNICNQFN
jgi:hypothetical protein